MPYSSLAGSRKELNLPGICFHFYDLSRPNKRLFQVPWHRAWSTGKVPPALLKWASGQSPGRIPVLVTALGLNHPQAPLEQREQLQGRTSNVGGEPGEPGFMTPFKQELSEGTFWRI